MFTSIMSEQSLLILPNKLAFRAGTGVGSAVGKYFIYSILEMFHHKMVLLLSILVLRLGLEPTELTGMGGSKPIRVLGQAD